MSNQASLNVDQTLNELVALDERFLPILNGRGLDTCCGGAHTLREAARRHGLDLAALFDELNAARGGG